MRSALAFLLAASFAYAQPDCAVLFREMYHERDFYHPARCALNAHKVVNRLIEKGVPEEKINVVYLLYEESHYAGIPGMVDLMPPNTRMGPLWYTWPRHVVVEVDGKIYDTDFKDEPTPAREYFKKMFPHSRVHPGGNLENHIFLRVVPAKRNRDEFWFKGGSDGAVVQVLGPREDKVEGLPRRRAKDWLDTLPN